MQVGQVELYVPPVQTDDTLPFESHSYLPEPASPCIVMPEPEHILEGVQICGVQGVGVSGSSGSQVQASGSRVVPTPQERVQLQVQVYESRTAFTGQDIVQPQEQVSESNREFSGQSA